MYSIYPYKISGLNYIMYNQVNELVEMDGIWVFDDISTGLQAEALISGTDTMIEYMVSNIIGAEKGFKLTFSSKWFNGCQLLGKWYKQDFDVVGKTVMGNWYNWNLIESNVPNINGWLCPALFLYFPEPPTELFVAVNNLSL